MPTKHRSAKTASLVVLAVVCGAGSLVHLAGPAPGPGAGSYRLASLPEAPPATTAPAPTPTRLVAQETVRTLGQARGFSRAFSDVAATVTPAVVRIETERRLDETHPHLGRFRDMLEGLPEDHPEPPLYPEVGGGTGVLVSADGLILTNNHVISDADRIRVTLADKRVFQATVVGSDPTTDIALIAIDAEALPTARLGNSDDVRVGEWVLAIGNPGFERASTLDFTVTSGIVSAKGRPLDIIRSELSASNSPAAAYAIEDFIQTDAAINPGNSGGPLLDLDGKVIGINTAIASRSGFSEGYGFAVPVNVARRVMADLLEHGRVRRPLLGIGIQNVTPEDAEVYGLPRIAGVLIEDFAGANSPARTAGLERHDVIVALDGTRVDRLGQFQRLVASHEPGEVVEVDVIRYGQRLRVPVRLTEARFAGQPVVRTQPEPRARQGLGLELVDLTPSLARETRFSQSGGALIAAVAPGSPAMRKGVQRGLVIQEINRQPVETADEAERLLESLPAGSVASLVLRFSEGSTIIRNVRVP